jgi:pimeloyl-ACP methyl ester carboxylesterase
MINYTNTLIKPINRLGLILVSMFLLYACESDTSSTVRDSIDTTPVEKALFNPGDSVIPFPNDLLFGADGTLDIPVTDTNDYSDPQVAMNTNWGFSTGAPMSTSFSSAIDAASISGDSVRVYEVTLSSKPGGAAVAVSGDQRLTYGVDYVASVSGFDANNLAIVPLRPLNYDSSYLVVLTNGLHNTAGAAYTTDLVYTLLKNDEPLVDAEGNSRVGIVPDPVDAARLELLRQATNVNESTAASFDTDLNRDAIILSWTFTTQPAGPVLDQARTLAQNTIVVSNINAIETTQSPNGAANIHVGTLTIPYYLQAPSVNNPTAALNGFWKDTGGSFLTPASQIPQKTGDETIPLLLSIPTPVTATKPAGGWPVVIFQHGITSSRQAMLGAADALAGAGFAVVAIDLPLHGLPTADSLRQATETFDNNAQARHFDMDLVDNTSSLPGPDGTPDSSGFHFINLSNLAVTRDNVRQSVADLFALTKALQTMDYDGDTGNTDFDTSRIYFMGHSLGGIVGSVFVALEPNVQDAVLAMPGAGVAKLLDGSATFGPIIAGGLALNGVNKGTADYEAFMGAAQTVIDPADPINYVDRTGSNRGVLLFEVVGDLVIPNTVPDMNSVAGTVPAPLAGTTPLATFLGLTQYGASASGVDLAAWVRFSTDNDGSAHHGSVLTPADAAGNTNAVSEAVFFEMQTELATFLASDGAVLPITDDTYIVAP